MIKLAHDHKGDSPQNMAAEWIKKTLEKESNGEISVQIYPSQMLGTGPQMVEMLQTNTIQVLAVPVSNVQSIQPGMQVLELPFLFPDRETLYGKLDGPLGKALYEPLKAKGIPRHGLLGKRIQGYDLQHPDPQPGRSQGVKFRIMPSPVIREQYLALGASPVPSTSRNCTTPCSRGCGRRGKPADEHRDHEVPGGTEIRHADQPRLARLLRHGQQGFL